MVEHEYHLVKGLNVGLAHIIKRIHLLLVVCSWAFLLLFLLVTSLNYHRVILLVQIVFVKLEHLGSRNFVLVFSLIKGLLFSQKSVCGLILRHDFGVFVL